MSGKSAKRRRRSYGRHEPDRVMRGDELAAALADLESAPGPMGGQVLDVAWSLPPSLAAAIARKSRSDEHDHGGGVE